MVDQQTKERIEWWVKEKAAKYDADPFIKFIVYWFCFNSFLTNLSGEDRDREALNWFKQNDNCLKDATKHFWQSIDWALNGLRELSPVYDARPRHHGEMVELTDINDVGQVTEVVYQIRCNLFHGSKSPVNHRDKELVKFSSAILERWVNWALQEC